MKNAVWRGRILLLSLIFVFAMPVISAKLILSNQWYESGVTNRGLLIEPSTTFSQLGVDNPLDKTSWQLAYMIPEVCDSFCQKQLHLLGQSYAALGKEKSRVEPVVFVSDKSDPQAVSGLKYQTIEVSSAFSERVSGFEYVIVDPLGQLVMRYPKASEEEELVSQSKGLLADFRKLLKLSRVG
ncbi:hypothetical protein KP803_12065 [Vibrio sp. ZSDE26]|uniref:Cytochrome oxidase biogenesis cluster protein n=1 Tax=Vibrio amylolyticus TaxID=2847292 RepID=A0A9X2BHI2_9VIBR|nr:hypothetical protein [Vibrio amylolyticus]MCK6264006.1 hypothetical protein [Vibrio amylolyticus]